jgi:hypothetical protein
MRVECGPELGSARAMPLGVEGQGMAERIGAGAMEHARRALAVIALGQAPDPLRRVAGALRQLAALCPRRSRHWSRHQLRSCGSWAPGSRRSRSAVERWEKEERLFWHAYPATLPPDSVWHGSSRAPLPDARRSAAKEHGAVVARRVSQMELWPSQEKVSAWLPGLESHREMALVMKALHLDLPHV